MGFASTIWHNLADSVTVKPVCGFFILAHSGISSGKGTNLNKNLKMKIIKKVKIKFKIKMNMGTGMDMDADTRHEHGHSISVTPSPILKSTSGAYIFHHCVPV
jgi:hypothetical protein